MKAYGGVVLDDGRKIDLDGKDEQLVEVLKAINLGRIIVTLDIDGNLEDEANVCILLNKSFEVIYYKAQELQSFFMALARRES